MKKQFKLVLVMAIMICTMVPIANANDTGLSIDVVNAYDDMECSYTNGYQPRVEHDRVKLALPLINNADIAIDNDRIKVNLDLGSKGYSPFYHGDYTRYFYLDDYTINNAEEKKQAYLINYNIPLAWYRCNGSYPIKIMVTYKVDGKEQSQDFVVYVNIIDSKNNTEYKSDKEPKSRGTHSAPSIIVSDYSFSEDVVIAGEEFQMFLTLTNTNDTWHAYNIRLDCDGETTDIIPMDKAGAFFIPELENKQEISIVLRFKAVQGAEAKPQKIVVSMEYEDNDHVAHTSSDDLVIEVHQPIRLVHDTVNMPKSANAGDSLPISMQVFNMGKSTLYNVLVTLNMPGIIPDGSSYLGNIESGKLGTAEIYAFFGTLDMGDNAMDTNQKYGLSTGTITITYEDEYGKEYVDTIDLHTNIERPVFEDIYNQKEEPEEEPEKMGSWWISIGVLILIAVIILGITSYRRKIDMLRREYGREIDNKQ